MLTVTTRRAENATSASAPALYLSFELGEREWKLAFTLELGQRPRHRTVRARDLTQVLAEIAAAKARWGLAPATVVRSCYEAGREGFWLHRALTAHGVVNVVVDAASIEVNRRLRRAKADRLDNEKLVEMLLRYQAGERRVWHLVRVPSEADEDRRHLERERTTLLQEQTRLRNRLQGLLANQGVSVPWRGDVRAALARVRRWDGSALPPRCLQRCAQEWARLEAVAMALAALETERHRALAGGDAGGDAGGAAVSSWPSSARWATRSRGRGPRSCSRGGTFGMGARSAACSASRRRRRRVATPAASSGSRSTGTRGCARSRSRRRGSGCATSPRVRCVGGLTGALAPGARGSAGSGSSRSRASS